MCGIIGYCGRDDAVRRVIDGLYALEYRGYDSAGAAAFSGGEVKIIKSAGRVARVDEAIKKAGGMGSHCAVGHTRWATHGAPSDVNAHPHIYGKTVVVHNGIIENHAALAEKSGVKGKLVSETDSEVAAAVIDRFYAECGDPMAAIIKAKENFVGSYAFGVMFTDRPGEIFGAKKDSPLVIGVADGGIFTASDVTAFLKYTKRYIPLSDGETCAIFSDGYRVFDASGAEVKKEVLTATWDVAAAERGGYAHFMLKEIAEEPDAIRKTLSPRVKGGAVSFDSDGVTDGFLARIKKLTVVACGTARHAGLMAKYYFERFCRVPVDVVIASEFRYCDPIIDETDAVMIISQSGETADSLAALRLAREKGAKTVALVNVMGSSIAREADFVIYTYAGPEIAVASTKAYTVQAAALFALALRTAHAKGALTAKTLEKYTSALLGDLPEAINAVIARSEEIYVAAKKYHAASDVFFIGRGVDGHVADEASLKLKEISYIHSEAYAAGELKHGTLSLVTSKTPTVALATQSRLFEKTLSNVREVSSRGGKVFLICAPSFPRGEGVETRFDLPPSDESTAPLAAATACQLFAYHTAVLRGCDVDKPRNLAKSVTVE